MIGLSEFLPTQYFEVSNIFKNEVFEMIGLSEFLPTLHFKVR